MPASKRPRAGDPSAPSRQVRTRLSSRLQGLPSTPDDALSVTDKRSVADSAAAPPTPSVGEKNPAGPANPGIVRKRAQGALLRLPPDSDVLDEFSQLRRDGNLSDEQAFLKLITNYGICITKLSRISSNVYLLCFIPKLFARLLQLHIANTVDNPQPKGCLYHLVTLNMRT